MKKCSNCQFFRQTGIYGYLGICKPFTRNQIPPWMGGTCPIAKSEDTMAEECPIYLERSDANDKNRVDR